MIINGSRLNITDNSGAKEGECIHVLGGSKKKYASLGDVVVLAIKSVNPKGNMKKGDVSHAVIVRTKKEKRRSDGTYIRFSDNAAVLINKEKAPRGTRVFGPVAREEMKDKFPKIVSLAPESV
ncbi:MAG: 50S ribosomal protein L14 [Bacteroidota bacterium]